MADSGIPADEAPSQESLFEKPQTSAVPVAPQTDMITFMQFLATEQLKREDERLAKEEKLAKELLKYQREQQEIRRQDQLAWQNMMRTQEVDRLRDQQLREDKMKIAQRKMEE